MPLPPPPQLRRLGPLTATLLVVASMVGTGVFTTTGFLVRDIGSSTAILVCWALGGLLALTGALSYAELAAALPENGGEYALLSRVYHPLLGFMSGWVSFVVGFSATIAAVALGFSSYLQRVVPGVPGLPVAMGLVVLLTLVHGFRVSTGGRFQDVFTAAKVLLVAGFAVAGLLAGDPSLLLQGGEQTLREALPGSGFAIGLVYISFSYLGWNASVYVAGELRDPGRTLPLSLVLGTLAVTVLYLALNAVFLEAAPAGELSGVLEVGHVAAEHLFGEGAARVLSGIIAVGLISTVGAFVMTGPRIYEAMGQDFPALAFLSGRTPEGGPWRALGAQCVLCLVLMLTASFDALLTWIGFTLSLFAAATVAGVFVLRLREPGLPRPYRAWGYPVTPLLALALLGWMIAHTVISRPLTAVFGALTLLSGGGLYLLARWVERPRAGKTPPP